MTCEELRGLNDRLRTSLTECSSAVVEQAAIVGELRRGARSDAAIIAGLRVQVEDARVDLRSRPSVPGVVGRTLATSCVVGLAVAGARYTLTEAVDVWLLVVSGAQCVGAGVALSWGE